MKALNEVIDYIKKFLDDNGADAWTISYELPGYISERYNDIYEYDPKIAQLLNDDVIDWCAALDYEDGDNCISENTFRNKLYEFLNQLQ